MNSDSSCPPVLVLAFNRPDTTAKVFAAIREARPASVFFSVDGARPGRVNERQHVLVVERLVDTIDWECDVRTLIRNTNLGCKVAVSEAITWFFDHVESGIVLEDDCVAHPSFFPYVAELLARYRDDERVCMISGDNFQLGARRSPDSYYSSRFTHIWGWASWRRAWQLYDHSMSQWPERRADGWLEQFLGDAKAVRFWTRVFDDTYEGRNSSWAYRWTYSAWINDALTLIPAVNLVSNIGFGDQATHNLNKKNRFAALPLEQMSFPLRHPPGLVHNATADAFTQKTMYRRPPIWKRVGSQCLRTLRNLGD